MIKGKYYDNSDEETMSQYTLEDNYVCTHHAAKGRVCLEVSRMLSSALFTFLTVLKPFKHSPKILLV